MNEEVHQAIAANIRALRTARGWSVRQMAEECAKRGADELTQASLVNLERGLDSASPRGNRRVSVVELVFLADLFEVPLNDLIVRWESCTRCGGTGRARVEADR